MSEPLLTTKFYSPPARENLVPRPRLVKRLITGLENPLTLIAAPAGFGKTTLLSEWIPQCQHPCSWLSLDDNDDRFSRFWSYVIAAIQRIKANIGHSALALLQSQRLVLMNVVVDSLINEIAASEEIFVLILDDYHVIKNSEIHEAVTYLLEHSPPQLRLVLISRADPLLPLGRWRASGRMTEIRADELRFTIEESTSFLNQAMGLQITQEDVTELERRNEGWIAGLQLAALAMQGREDIPAFVHAFSGSHRHVLTYLVEEVLDRCSPGTYEFLIQTSILRRMTGRLCDALTGREDGQEVLEDLVKGNLFVQPLDDEGKWYRYHHLFADVLHHRLTRAQNLTSPRFEIAELHRQASRWFEHHALVEEALEHALAIPDHDLAASIVEKFAFRALFRSEVIRLRTWLAQLPEEVIGSRVRLSLSQGWILIFMEQLQAAEQALTSSTLTNPDLSDELMSEISLQKAFLARVRGDSLAASELAQLALSQIPSENHGMRAAALLEVGLAQNSQGDAAGAEQTLKEAASLGRIGGADYISLVAVEALRMIQARKGLLAEAAKSCEKTIELLTKEGLRTIPAAGMAYVGYGEVLCEWNDLDHAVQTLRQGVKLLNGAIEIQVLLRGHVALSRAYYARNDADSAHESLQKAEDWYRQIQMAVPGIMERLAAQRAKLWIWGGDLSAASRWEETSGLQIDESRDEIITGKESEYLILARLLIARVWEDSRGSRISEVLGLLERLLRSAELEGRTGSLIEIHCLRAMALQAKNDSGPALIALKLALSMAESGGYVRIFLDEGEQMRSLIRELRVKIESGEKSFSLKEDLNLLPYTARLLSEFPVPKTARAESPIHAPLTEREIEVLRLVERGASNRQIAEELFLSAGTVKTHLKHIFRKLSVSSRTQAVARARELLIL